MALSPAEVREMTAILRAPGYKIFAGTGHRPDKLGGYSAATDDRLRLLASWHLEQHPCHVVISGMAAGWDQALAWAAIEHKIPLVAAVPFQGQELRWPLGARNQYHELLSKAADVVIVDPDVRDDIEARRAFDKRNRWMVDRCTHLLTLWNGSSGGTANCIRYARHYNHGKAIKFYDLWPYWEKGVW